MKISRRIQHRLLNLPWVVSCYVMMINSCHVKQGKSDGEGTSGGAECTSMGHSNAEPDMFQTMDDITSLALDAVEPTSLFGLDQFGDLGSASDLLHQNM